MTYTSRDVERITGTHKVELHRLRNRLGINLASPSWPWTRVASHHYSANEVAALYVLARINKNINANGGNQQPEIAPARLMLRFERAEELPDAIGWVPGNGVVFWGSAAAVSEWVTVKAKRGVPLCALSLAPLLLELRDRD